MNAKVMGWLIVLAGVWCLWVWRYPIMLWIGKTLLLQAIEVR